MSLNQDNPAVSELPRLIVYQQTHHDPFGNPVSLLPLVENETGITHLYIAAVHVNEEPGDIRLNDHSPEDVRFEQLWSEVKTLQERGVGVMAMIGGAAQGSFWRLERDFESYYPHLLRFLRHHSFDGIDLDIEEDVSLAFVQKFIFRLRADFDSSFIITFAPVFPALVPLKPWLTSLTRRLLHADLQGVPPIISSLVKTGLLKSHEHLSGFNYFSLEASEAGKLVNWYNVQFYCGWGDARNPRLFESMVDSGWDPKKLVMGVITNPSHGAGHVDVQSLRQTWRLLEDKFGRHGLGGIMGWEYFAAGGQAEQQPWEWVRDIGSVSGRVDGSISTQSGVQGVSSVDGNSDLPSTTLPHTQTSDSNSTIQHANILAGLGQSLESSLTERSKDTVSSDTTKDDEHDVRAKEGNVQKLVEMGFERPEAIAALEAMGGDVNAAAGLLFGD